MDTLCPPAALARAREEPVKWRIVHAVKTCPKYPAVASLWRHGIGVMIVGAALSAGLVAAAAPATKSHAARIAGKPASPSAGGVSYARQIKPLLTTKCYGCHGNGAAQGGYRMDTRESFITGGETHPVVRPGDSANSLLIKMVRGEVPGKVMPPVGPRLTAVEVALLSRWIDEGASFGDVKPAAATWKPSLVPRIVALPPAKPGLENPIDRLLAQYFNANRVAPRPLVDDRTYARRVYLDLIGLLPPPEELRAFIADDRPDKRVRLGRRLLADRKNYAEHWLTFWNDALRNDYAGTGYIDGGRTQITSWLLNALAENKRYDRFVKELVSPTPDSAGFIKGIVWRGVVNASQTPEMQAAQNISQVFMGINLKCASCHNSFTSEWKLADAYGMAGIFAEKPLETVRCDQPTGEVAAIKFLYPELGAIAADAPREERARQLAALLTSPKNGRLARTMVNRLWARLMGRGLVEPADEMDTRPWSPELLDWLAGDFARGGYDLKRTMELIVTSRAYQLPAMSLKSERASSFTFNGPVVKRLSAEQFVDAVSTLTGVWSPPAISFQFAGGRPIPPLGARTVTRYRSGVMRSGVAEIDVGISGAEVLALVVSDGGNGGNFDWANWVEPRIVTPAGEVSLLDLPWTSATTGYGTIQRNRSIVEKPLRLGDRTYERGIGTHANSVITWRLPEGATRFRALAGPDTGATQQPTTETSIELFVLTGDRSLLETRAALAVSDPLTRALGRPNREQVVTQRGTVATTLQALELTNGQTLSAMLSEGAARYVGRPEGGDGGTARRRNGGTDRGRDGGTEMPVRITRSPNHLRLPTTQRPDDPRTLVRALYERALGRLPTAAEEREAVALVGSPPRREGIEDLLWALVLLPEFQLVY
jgi:mono/diheme cytochrome c family protein